MRKVALSGGVLYLITFAASMPGPLAVRTSSATRAHQHPGQRHAAAVGSWLEVVTAAACIGTAVALYPVTKRVSATAALGFVTSCVVEACLIIGVFSLLTIVTLRQELAGTTGAQADALVTTGQSLVALHGRAARPLHQARRSARHPGRARQTEGAQPPLVTGDVRAPACGQHIHHAAHHMW